MLTLFSLVALASAAAIPSESSPIAQSTSVRSVEASLQTAVTNLTTNHVPSLTTTPNLYCPFDIKGHFEFPHLIIPTNKEDPQQAPGTAYWAEMTSKKTTVFNFDVRYSEEYIGKTCALIFMFPYQTVPPAYEWSGMEAQEYSKGGLIFSKLVGPANLATTYANTPAVDVTYNKVYLQSGGVHRIATFPCNAGSQQTFSGTSVGIDDLKIFQSQAVSGPAGLFIVPCL